MRLGDDWWSDGGDSGPLLDTDPGGVPDTTWPSDLWDPGVGGSDPSGQPAPSMVADTPTVPDVYQPALSPIFDTAISHPAPWTPDANQYTPAGALIDYGPSPTALDPVEQTIRDLYRASDGTTLGADGLAILARAQHGDDEVLRDAQHALVTQQAIEEYGYVPAAVMAVVAVPAYSAAKWIAQNVPGAAAILQPLSSDPLTREGGATAPSWSEVYWGLRPLWWPLR